MTTPPGWHPDPGHTGPGPAPERWWDGSAWTAHTRFPAGLPPQVPPPPERPSRGPLVAAVIAAAVVVTALVAGTLLLLGGSGEAGDRARPGGGTGADKNPGGDPTEDGTPGEGPEDSEDVPPDGDGPGTAVDRTNGVSVPVPEGWSQARTDTGIWLSSGSYPCPGDTSLGCVRGGVSVRPADPGAGTDPEAVAEADIARNAEESYDAKAYGGVAGHQVVSSGEVTVAGQRGHRIRWRIDNRLEPDAYVESVVFPAPDGGRLLVMRLGFDVHADAPSPAEMDRIVSGVRAADGPGMEV
ncbi:hypothetical protein CUT44_25145 [Streptomyces carminius]|uniref:DUF2510 domain-containing protein n=1 Tax=Streptomyces carminius TaxID=2665496 RepID=A0A2M8LSQ0_9ACTN|nr:DUF2510 domain-containing protein [Streptomyces carminius]PJE94959.1 hypothetical protein CUT44_25145 [Streptomyces carminius]